MRSYFVHEATLELAPEADQRAGGAAVTAALCGHWEHEGACRWPHHTAVDRRSGQTIGIRTVFACEESDEAEVRGRIRQALGAGRLDGPAGLSRWRLVSEAAGDLRAPEAELAHRL